MADAECEADREVAELVAMLMEGRGDAMAERHYVVRCESWADGPVRPRCYGAAGHEGRHLAWVTNSLAIEWEAPVPVRVPVVAADTGCSCPKCPPVPVAP